MSVLPERLDIDGTQICYLNDPDDFDPAIPKLILLNGLATKVDKWGEYPKHLKRAAIGVDATQSSRIGFVPTMHTYARQIARAIEEITEDPVDLDGYSKGGMEAQAVAIDYPHLIRRLVLKATAPFAQCGWPSPKAVMNFGIPDRSSERFIRNAPDMYEGDVRKNPELVISQGIARETNFFTFYQQIGAVVISALSWDILRVHTIQQPTLIISSDDDSLVPQENAETLHRLIPNSRLIIIPGGGHAFVMTQPEPTAAMTNEFLDDEFLLAA